MEETNKDKSAWCECPCCRGYKYGTWGHGSYFLRWILVLIILGMVFCLGVKIGEFRGEFQSGYGTGFYGHHRMMYPGTFNKMFQYQITPPASSTPQ